MRAMLVFLLLLSTGVLLNSIPVKIAEINQNITDFHIVDNTLYAIVTSEINSQLMIYDLSSPSNPELIGSYENTYDQLLETPCITVENGTAFIINQMRTFNFVPVLTQLCIFDVTDPGGIEVIANHDLPLSADSIELEADRAYISSSDSLHIYDISNLQQVTLLNSIEIDDIQTFFISNNLGFASCRESGLKIYSLDIPTAPELLSVIHNVCDMDYTFYTDNTAYICNSENGVLIYDLTDPTEPEYIAQCGSCTFSRSCFVQNDVLLITDYHHGLEVYDVSDMYNPQFVTAYNPPDTSVKTNLLNHHAFIGGSKGHIIDFSDITNPEYITHFDIAHTEFHNVKFQDQYAHAYIGSYSQFHFHRVQIIDYSNMFDPLILGEYPKHHTSYGHAVTSQYAYTLTLDGFNIFDVTDPEHPDVLSTTSDCGNRDLAINGDIAVTISYSTIYVIDISNPQLPHIESTYELGWLHQEQVFLYNDHVYVLDPLQGIAIYTLQSDHTLNYVSYMYLTQVKTIHFRDSYLLASQSNSLSIIDISNVHTPSVINSISIPDHRTYLQDDRFFVFDTNWNRLHVYDVNTITNPQWLGFANYNYQISDISSYLDHIVILTKNQGFFVYDDLWNLVSISAHEITIPSEQYVITNYPNPFNPTTTIAFSVAEECAVDVCIYNVKGQKIKELKAEMSSRPSEARGEIFFSTTWDGTNADNKPVSSGVYFCRVIAGTQESSIRMVLIK